MKSISTSCKVLHDLDPNFFFNIFYITFIHVPSDFVTLTVAWTFKTTSVPLFILIPYHGISFSSFLSNYNSSFKAELKCPTSWFFTLPPVWIIHYFLQTFTTFTYQQNISQYFSIVLQILKMHDEWLNNTQGRFSERYTNSNSSKPHILWCKNLMGD